MTRPPQSPATDALSENASRYAAIPEVLEPDTAARVIFTCAASACGKAGLRAARARERRPLRAVVPVAVFACDVDVDVLLLGTLAKPLPWVDECWDGLLWGAAEEGL